MKRIYACIDLKSFYASVECVERGFDPLNTHLVVADSSRTEKTICLAVSPSLKEYGLSGRSRLYEVISKVRSINQERKKYINKFIGKSCNKTDLEINNNLELDYIIAKPRMAYYIKYSTDIYNIYLKYISKEDIFPYSIDEVFIDITHYLKYYNKKPEELITVILKDVLKTTGITATAGIGTNLYLAKIAMDIMAKKIKTNDSGVRIAYLDEYRYRKYLWDHKPISDFWRIGKGYEKKLANLNLYTMGDIAKFSLTYEDILFKTFGVNAEILIDHAFGYDPCNIKDIKNYKPDNKSLSSGQVLTEPYNYIKTKLIVREMIDLLSLDLIAKNLKTNQLVLTIGYDISNINKKFKGEVAQDYYGRCIPKPSHGTINISKYTSSQYVLTNKLMELFDKIINKNLLVRRINISVNNLLSVNQCKNQKQYQQFNIFDDYTNFDSIKLSEKIKEQEDITLGKTIVNLKTKYGKNVILKGMNLCEGATTISRNQQIGGHKA